MVRSSGAVVNALDRLVQLGIAMQTSEKPRRFQLSPEAPAWPAPADAAQPDETGTTEQPADEPATAPEPGNGTEPGITADAA
jgi:hypothetical protein